MKIHILKPVIRWWSLVDNHLLAHYTEALEIHTDRFVHRQGILNKRECVIRFSHITNYAAEQNLFDRLFGVANFSIETAAGALEPELVLRGYPYQLRNFLSRMLDRIVSLG
jgi:uncharacterized membrane protein YdbT with pleckstrin-like domain